MSRRFLWIGIAVFVVVACGLVWLAMPRKPVELPRSLVSVRIGGHTTILGAPLVVAKDKGYYRDEGLDVQVLSVESSKESMAAMVGGDFFLVIGSIAAGSFNLAAKADFKVVADAARVMPSLVIRKDLYDSGTLTEIRQLKGRRVATPREGSASYYALSRILENARLKIDDLQPKYLKEKEAVAALEAKSIDAAILNEPFAASAVSKGIGTRYPLAKLTPLFPLNGQEHMLLYTTGKTARTQPDVLRRFLRAYLKAVRLYDEARSGKQPAREEVIEIIAGYTGMDKQLVEAAWWPYVPPDGRPDAEYLRKVLAYFRQQDLVTEPVDLDEVIDLRFLP